MTKRRRELITDDGTPAFKKSKPESSVSTSIFKEGVNFFALIPVEIMQLILTYCSDTSMYRIFIVCSLNRSLFGMDFSRGQFFAKRLNTYYGIDYFVNLAQTHGWKLSDANEAESSSDEPSADEPSAEEVRSERPGLAPIYLGLPGFF